MSQSVFTALKRDRVGKGAARALRREGRVPAVIYGDKKDPVSVSLSPIEVMKELRKEGFFSHLFTVAVKGGKKETVIAKDVQFHPVTDAPMHIDFLRVAKGAQIVVEVPVHFLNEETCLGIKRGGTLNVVRHEVELHCPATSIPEYLELDLGEGEIGDSFKISSIKLPEGAVPTITDRDFVIATIVGRAAESEETAEAAEGGAEAEDEA